MSDSDAWREMLRRIEETAQRMRSMPPEQRASEALIEIVGQLIELNQGVSSLTEAVYAIADAPRQ